jgi:outer membrane protein TolC
MRWPAILILLLAATMARADDALEPWIDTALTHNPEVAAAKQRWIAAQQKVLQARAFEDPMIGVDVERMDTTRFDTFTGNEWMISQKLPWFGKRGAKGRVAQLEAEVFGFRYLELTRDVRARVIGAYWDLWFAQESARITGENKVLMKQFERIARIRYETGAGMQADVLRAQITLAKMSNEVVTMEREIPVAVNAINKLLNAAPDAPRSVAGTVELPPLSLSLEEMQARARQYCCILLSFLRAAEAKVTAVRVARLESAPDFEFRVEARQFNGRSGIQEYDTGVFMNFPWLWRGKYRAMVNEAKADAAMAQADLGNEVNMTMLEVKELYTKADAAWRWMRLYEDTVLPQARQLVESTRAGYETGSLTFLELVEAQAALLDAQLDNARARAEYGRTRAKLEAFIAPWGEREFATGLVTRDMK